MVDSNMVKSFSNMVQSPGVIASPRHRPVCVPPLPLQILSQPSRCHWVCSSAQLSAVEQQRQLHEQQSIARMCIIVSGSGCSCWCRPCAADYDDLKTISDCASCVVVCRENPYKESSLDGGNLNPVEVMFIKVRRRTNRRTCSAGIVLLSGRPPATFLKAPCSHVCLRRRRRHPRLHVRVGGPGATSGSSARQGTTSRA